MSMGAGGLLAEIPARGLKRAEAGAAPDVEPGTKPVAKVPPGPRIAALLLAAGKSSRMGSNKMLEEIDGRPMVARTAQRLLSSHARPIVAVLGNQADAVDAALGKLPVERVRNPDYTDGLSTSLKCGLAALPGNIDGAVVCLGDMPLIAGRDIDRLIAAFNPLEGRAIVVPTRRGQRGNPLLWSRQFFPEMMALSGDSGARRLIDEHADLVAEIEMDTDSVLIDIDTQDALADLRERVKPSAA
jgi:molybdenum cofactor cytidylyltransferase